MLWRSLSLLLLIALIVGGAMVLQIQAPEAQTVSAPEPPEPETIPKIIKPKAETAVSRPRAEPDPKPIPITNATPDKPLTNRTSIRREEFMQQQREACLQQHKTRYNKLMQQLENERNPQRRMQLIRIISNYVRFNTVETTEWALSLDDPAEKQAAMEAISEDALSGVGALLAMGPEDRPVIRDLSPLGALESSGAAQPGDIIAGMINPDGSTTYFQSMSMPEIVKYLRGDPGTEVQILLERPADAGGAAYTFDITLKRSMLVVEPPE